MVGATGRGVVQRSRVAWLMPKERGPTLHEGSSPCAPAKIGFEVPCVPSHE